MRVRKYNANKKFNPKRIKQSILSLRSALNNIIKKSESVDHEFKMYTRITYDELGSLIQDYYKETYGIDGVIAKVNEDSIKNGVLIAVKEDIGSTGFNIEKEDVNKIIESYVASSGKSIRSINYDRNYIELSWGYDQYFDPKNVVERNVLEKPKLDFNGSISFDELRKIILNYYINVKGINVAGFSGDDLKKYISNPYYSSPLFINIDNGKAIDITKEEIFKDILVPYFEKEGLELKEVEYDEAVHVSYVHKPEKDKETEIDERIKKFGEKIGSINKLLIPELEEEEKDTALEVIDETKQEEVDEFEEELKGKKPFPELPVKDEEQRRYNRENRRFQMLQRERGIREAEKKQIKYGIIAGLSILGTIGLMRINPNLAPYFTQTLSDKLSSNLGDLAKFAYDMGLAWAPAAAAVLYISRIYKLDEKIKEIRGQMEDFKNSLEENGGKKI